MAAATAIIVVRAWAWWDRFVGEEWKKKQSDNSHHMGIHYERQKNENLKLSLGDGTSNLLLKQQLSLQTRDKR